jgi:hypothetical protein
VLGHNFYNRFHLSEGEQTLLQYGHIRPIEAQSVEELALDLPTACVSESRYSTSFQSGT